MKEDREGEVSRCLAGVGREDGGSAMDGDESTPALPVRALQTTVRRTGGTGTRRRRGDHDHAVSAAKDSSVRHPAWPAVEGSSPAHLAKALETTVEEDKDMGS
jgi:hypothetical protein